MQKDRYKYFRIEAREILDGLAQGVIDLEKGVSAPLVDRLLRLAHTLKGAARVVGQDEIAEHSHALEDLLMPCRAEGHASEERVAELLRALDGIEACLAALSPAPAAPTPPVAPSEPAVIPTPVIAPMPGEESLETARVELADLEGLLQSVTEARVHLEGISDHAETLSQLLRATRLLTDSLDGRTRALGERPCEELGALQRRMGRSLSLARQEFDEIRERASALRLLPATMLTSRLDRAVRDAAQTLGKHVRFEAFGGETRLDGHLLLSFRDALVHVVRNAVDHGIESPAEREAARKPAQGRVQLRIERQGTHVLLVCEDDGRGIDPAVVREAALRRGLVVPDDPDALLQTVLLPGFSTAPQVTAISGRGVGLDVLSETLRRFKGELTLRNVQGQGLQLTIRVPMHLSAIEGLAVEASGQIAHLPFGAVRRTVRVAEAEIRRGGSGVGLIFDGKLLPFCPLAELLGMPPAKDPSAWTVVIVETHGRWAAVGVDRLLGTQELLIRPLPEAIPAQPLLEGVVFDPEGIPQPVLDPGGLIDGVELHARAPVRAESPRRKPILIIDDSLTTRMLEQSILESAGYEVDLAVSAEEGLLKAAEREYGLFVVDVEMPGMNGFAFVEFTQSDARLQAVPSILMTSLSSPEDRQRGAEVGAKAYMVKGEFDQAYFLQAIHGLMGD